MEDKPEASEGIEQLYCFLNAQRVCGADCMAFVTYPRESTKSELQGLQPHCAFINNADRVGRNVVIMASSLVERQKQQKLAQIDAQREANTPRASAAPGPFAQPTSPFPTSKT